jgi:outer membrane lipoprotein-sorting protein
MKALNVLILLVLVGSFCSAVETPGKNARKLLDKVDDIYRGESSWSKVSMKVVTEHWSREMKMEAWSKGKDRSLIRILSPRKEKGTATLKVGEKIWNYLPKVKRTILLPSSMMGGSWMGSHFTNDDLIKDGRLADDYDFKISFQGQRDGLDLIEISCIPKPDAAVVWGKIVVVVRASDEMPLRLTYYDEDMELARTMTFDEFKLINDRKFPTLTRMVPADKPGEFTEYRVSQIAFDVKLKDKFFSLRSLQK